MDSKLEIQKIKLAESTWAQPINRCSVDVCLAHCKSIAPIRELMGFSVICIQHSGNLNLYCIDFIQVPLCLFYNLYHDLTIKLGDIL